MSLLNFWLFEHQIAQLNEIPPEMAPNFGCTDLMVLSGRYQASALQIEE
jgi:hypothetical protein